MPAFSEAAAAAPSARRARGVSAQPAATAMPSRAGDDAPLRLPPNPARYQGPATRYTGSFSAGWYTSNGLPAVGPPWTQLVAYDLNDGTMKWRVPDGRRPASPRKGITQHGHRAAEERPGGHRRRPGVRRELSGPHASRLRQRRPATVLWEHEIEANPEGIPAVYRVGGRQYSPLPPAPRGARAPIRSGGTRSTASRARSKRRGTTCSRCRARCACRR